MFRVRTRVVPCLAGTAVIAAAGFVSAAPASAHSLGSRTLQRGAKGADVSALQADLSQAGFVTTANGRFTAETAAEVKRFQRFYQLKATGVADAHTIAVVRQVDKLDADATDATSGGSGLAVRQEGQGQGQARQGQARGHQRPDDAAQEQPGAGARQAERRLRAPGQPDPEAGHARPRRPRAAGLPDGRRLPDDRRRRLRSVDQVERRLLAERQRRRRQRRLHLRRLAQAARGRRQGRVQPEVGQRSDDDDADHHAGCDRDDRLQTATRPRPRARRRSSRR